MGGVQYRGGISWVSWWGDIMSTMGGVQYCGGIPSFEIWVPWGDIMSAEGVFSTVGYSNNKRFSPHGTEHLHGTHDIPPWYWTSPTVLKITPHGTHDIPPRYSWYPPRYWTPPQYSRNPPHLLWYPPTVLNTPHSTQDIPPRYSWYPPRYCTHIIQGGWCEYFTLKQLTK